MDIVNDLISKGYKYLFIPKRVRSKFYVTKSEVVNDDTDFDEYVAESDYEKKVIKVFDKNTLIKLF